MSSPALLDLDDEIEGGGQSASLNSADYVESQSRGIMQVNPVGAMTQAEVEKRTREVSAQIDLLQGASGMLDVDAAQLVSE